MRRELVVGAALSLAACANGGSTAGSDAAPSETSARTTTVASTNAASTLTPDPSQTTALASTQAIAPPTTSVTTATDSPVTTTATTAPTIAPPTTPSDTAAASSPGEVAVADVTVRLNDFWKAMDECFEEPDDCDTAPIIDEYADPTTPIATWFKSWIEDFRNNSLRATQTNRITRELVETVPNPDGLTVLTTQCITNAGVLVQDNENGSIVFDDATAYTRVVMMWRRHSERWTVQGSEYIPLEQAGDAQCSFN